MVQAVRLNTLSKLTFSDSTRFDALLRDVFPAVDFHEVHYEELKAALLGAYEEAQLEIIPGQVHPLIRTLGLFNKAACVIGLKNA